MQHYNQPGYQNHMSSYVPTPQFNKEGNLLHQGREYDHSYGTQNPYYQQPLVQSYQADNSNYREADSTPSNKVKIYEPEKQESSQTDN